MKQTLLLALLLLTLPSLVHAQGVGFEFSTTATLGGSGKTWRFRVTAVASADPPAQGQVKLLNGDATTSYTDFTGTIELPRTVAHGGLEYRVTTTENPLFEGSAVTGITFGDALTSLPLSDKGFGTNVADIYLGDIRIASEFLTKAHLGSTLTSLTASGYCRPFPDNAFAGVTSLKTLKYPNYIDTHIWPPYLPHIGKGAFAGCPLENLDATSVSTGPFAFSHAISIGLSNGYSTGARYWPSTLVFRPELPGAVEPYSPQQFASPNNSLTTVTSLPDWSGTYVPAAYFYNFTALTTFPWNTLYTVSDSAFMNTSVGSAFTAAPNLTSIGRRAFANAKINTRRTPNAPLKLQASLTSIAPYAFANNPDLTHADLRALDFAKLGLNTLTYLDVVAKWFDGCPMAEILYPAQIPVGNPTPGFTFYSTASTGGSGKRWRFRITAAASANPPAQGQVKLLKDGEYTSFSGTIELPRTVAHGGLEYRVTSTENPLFEGSGVTGVYVSSALPSLDPSTSGFGSGVTQINLDGSNLPSTYLTQEYLGSNLTSLTAHGANPFLDYAFKDVTSLTDLNIAWNFTQPNIGKGAFAGCPINRAEIALYGSVGYFAFSHAKTAHFTSTGWPSTLVFRPELPDYAPDSPQQLASANTSLTTVTQFPNWNSYIPNAFFYNFTALSSIGNWAASSPISTIGDSAFMNTNLGASFTAATSLTTVGLRAFANAGIDTRTPNAPLKLQASLTSIAPLAFADNPDLTRLDLRTLNANLSLANNAAAGWFEGSPIELLIVGNQALPAGAFTAFPHFTSLAVLTTDLTHLNADAYPTTDVPKTLYLDYGLLDADITGFNAYTRKPAFVATTAAGARTTFRGGLDAKLDIPLTPWANYLDQEVSASGLTPTATLPATLTDLFDATLTAGKLTLVPKGTLPTGFSTSFEVALPASDVTFGLTPAPFTLSFDVAMPVISAIAPTTPEALQSLANGKPVGLTATVTVDGVVISTPTPADARVAWETTTPALVTLTAGAWNSVTLQLLPAAAIGQTISLKATLPAELGGHSLTWDYTIVPAPPAVGEVFSAGELRYKISALPVGGSAGRVAVTGAPVTVPRASSSNGYPELTSLVPPVAVEYDGGAYTVTSFEAGALASATNLTAVKLLWASAAAVPSGAAGAFAGAGGAAKSVYVSKDMTGISWANGWDVVPAYAVTTPGGAADTAVSFSFGIDATRSLPYVLRDNYLGITVGSQEPVAAVSSSLEGLFDVTGGAAVVLTPKGDITPSAVSGSVGIAVGASAATVGLTPSELSVTVSVHVPSITGVAPVDAAAAASLANGKPVAMKATVEVDGVAISTPVPADARVQWTSAPEGLVDITPGSAWNAVSIQLTAAAKIGDAISLTATLPAEFGGHSATWDYTIPAPPAAVGEVFGYDVDSDGIPADDQLRYKITSLPADGKLGTVTITADPVSIPRPSDYDTYLNPRTTIVTILESIPYGYALNGKYINSGLYFDIDSIEPKVLANYPNLRMVHHYALNAPRGIAAAFAPGTAANPKTVYVDASLTSMEWAEGWTVKPMYSVLTPEGKSETTLTFHHSIHDQLTLPYIIRDNDYADNYPGYNPDYFTRPEYASRLTPTRAHEPALAEVFTLSHPNHLTLHLSPLSSDDHESTLKISFAPFTPSIASTLTPLTPAPLTVHLKAYTPVIDTLFTSITPDKPLKRLRFGEAVTLTANDPYERVEGERLTRPFKLTSPLRWIYDAERFTGSVPLVHYIKQPYSLTLTPNLPSTLNFNVPLTFTLPYPESPVATLPAAEVSLSLSYDTTFLPATARIRATVLVDDQPLDPTPHFLTWHQDPALNLSLAASAPTNPYSTRPPAPVLSVADDGSFTARLISVNPGYGRVHYTLPPTWGSVKSPELAFYSVLDLLGVYPPTLVEGRIVLYEVGHPDAPIDLSTPLVLREGVTRYLYARVATDIPTGQGHTLLTPFLTWSASPTDLITCDTQPDGSFTLTARLGSSSFGATPTLTVGIDPSVLAGNPAIDFPSDLVTSPTLTLPAPAALSFSILPAAPAPAPAPAPEPVPPIDPVPAPDPAPTPAPAPVEPELPVEPEEPELPVEPEEPEPEAEPEPVEPETEPVEPEAEPVEPEPVVVAPVDSPPLGTIAVGNTESSYTIYTLSGRAVSAPLKAGLYIVKGEGKVRKVVVR